MIEIACAEEWRPVVGWEGIYSVSDLGRIRRDVAGRRRQPPAGFIITPARISSGYLKVGLSDGPRQEQATVHSIVAAAFIGPRPPGHDVNHKDGNKHHNAATNLEYVSRAANMLHAFDVGLAPRGEAHPDAILTDEQVAEIKRLHHIEPQLSLARRFGVARTTISGIQNGHNRKAVKA